MLSVDQLLTDTSVKYRPTIGEVSAKCRRKVGEVSVNEKLYQPRHIWNDYRPCLDRVSSHYRSTIDRYIDRLSTEYRPTVDRLSTESRPLYRPLCRPISRSTLPTVNKIHYYYHLSLDHLRNYCFIYSNCKLPGFLSNSRIMKTMILLISMGSLHLNSQLLGN